MESTSTTVAAAKPAPTTTIDTTATKLPAQGPTGDGILTAPPTPTATLTTAIESPVAEDAIYAKQDEAKNDISSNNSNTKDEPEAEEKRNTKASSASTHKTTESMVTVRLSDPPAMPSPTPTLKLVDEKSEEFVIGGSDTMFAPERTESPVSADATSRGGSIGEESSPAVDWAGLEKTECDHESQDGTAFLLARLEQENKRLEQDPKAAHSHPDRPPSLAKLRRLMDNPDPNTLRYSMLPAPPPLTDLDFYAALVSDYNRAASKLPNLLSKKIRGGVPPPLRGVVWIAMSGARDCNLEGLYDQLLGETSPYEQLIGKDIGRTGLEMFKQDGGEEQRMLGRVLRAFSIYDTQIGYCQGLGFLVGPLLMHMGEKEAFCVLVRLMEHYDLRSCFLPDLYGLRLRMYQFTQLMAQHLPDLSSHLCELGIQPTYASQWFLSFFAVSCPLPLLFRIYDVIFAEGAPETMMRVALSLMRRNEKRFLATSEFEDVMQMLLSRVLWDTYNYNADDLVQDFVSFSSVVTRDVLAELQKKFEEPEEDSKAKVAPVMSQFTDLQAMASGFLGRLWGGATSVSLSPGALQSKRASRISINRTPSKNSLSTVSSYDTHSGPPSITTDATTMSRGSSISPSDPRRMSGISISSTRKANNRDGELHGQIEDLLVALSALQREHAAKMNELRQVTATRDEERTLTKRLVELLGSGSCNEEESVTEISDLCDTITARFERVETEEAIIEAAKQAEISHLTERLENTKDQLTREIAHSKTLAAKLSDSDAEVARLKTQLQDARTRCKEAQKENQNLQKTIADLKSGGVHDNRRHSREISLQSPVSPNSPSSSISTSNRAPGGLRELRLGRTTTSPSIVVPPRDPISPVRPTFNKRSSSLGIQQILSPSPSPSSSSPPTPSPSTDQLPPSPQEEQLLLELVASKTAEAIAKQEAEEAKQKLETLRKVLGGSLPSPGLGGMVTPVSPGLLGGQEVKKEEQGGGGWWSAPWGVKRAATTSDGR